MTQQKDFLSEHNKLSPFNLQATFALLSRFKAENPSLFKSDDWPLDKLRRPFIMWLTSLQIRKITTGKKNEKQPQPEQKQK